jgi:hypothetical protein
MPSSHIEQATWYLQVTAMPPTFRRPTHAAGQADISSCPTMKQFPATMVQSSQSCKSSKPSCHPWRMQKLELTTYTNANRQHYSTWSGKQQCYKKMKVDGHEIPLVPMQNKPTSIPPLLGCGQIKQWQLRHCAAMHNAMKKTSEVDY